MRTDVRLTGVAWMDVTEEQRRLLELCAIRVDRESMDWSLIARQAQFADGLDTLWQGIILEKSAAAQQSQSVLQRPAGPRGASAAGRGRVGGGSAGGGTASHSP